MSRTGNKIIEIENGVELIISSNEILTKGPKGELCAPKFEELTYKMSDNTLSISRKNDSKKTRQLHGLSRSLIYNNVLGVTKGYVKNLYLTGIGYRVQLKGSDLEFSLGYSHPILYKAPKNIKFAVEGQNKFSVQSIDNQLVGQVCAEIIKLRKKDSYKGKGIFFQGFVPSKKPGKSLKK